MSLVPGQVKLFADGAIISQLMQMRDGYLDAEGKPNPHHCGEWIMQPADLRRYFDAYWDAGWQIHIHVNGDLGLDVVLDVIEGAMTRQPRIDHRTMIVHFANSTEDQVVRIARLGAIVSANPYYPVGFADRYAEFGLGPTRADVMVRAASICRAEHLTIVPLRPFDVPVGPAGDGWVRREPPHALRPGRRPGAADLGARRVARRTIGSAHSWRRDRDLGSVEPGKIANFTVLSDGPDQVDPTDLARIRILGSIFEGRWFPVPVEHQNARLSSRTIAPARVDVGEITAVSDHGCGARSRSFSRSTWPNTGSPPEPRIRTLHQCCNDRRSRQRFEREVASSGKDMAHDL